MKILQCNIYEHDGGAAIAVHRLHEALNASGVCTSILGLRNNIPQGSNSIRLASRLDVLLTRLTNLPLRLLKKNPQDFFSHYLLPNSVAKRIHKFQPDILHLHWISNFISPWTLRQITKLNIPVVWTLHDTWAFTGGCHYFGTCQKWMTNCQDCPALHKPFGIDIAAIQWKIKQKSYKDVRPNIIGLSKHFKMDIEQSALLKNYPCTHLPNTIDSAVFCPIPKTEARQRLGLSQDRVYILFGAMSANSDLRKGYDLLKDALQYISNSHSKTQCFIFGASEGESLPIPSTFLGRINCPEKLAFAYAAADVFVCPSREESFSQTTLESLACGTPVVGFDIGGIPDMVSHKESGYIATPYDTQDLAKGIAYILEDENRRQAMGQAARATVEERYAYPIVAQQYIQLYEKILAQHKK